jgi:hypothetical protein
MRIRFLYQAQLDYEEDCTKSHLVTVESEGDGGKEILTLRQVSGGLGDRA